MTFDFRLLCLFMSSFLSLLYSSVFLVMTAIEPSAKKRSDRVRGREMRRDGGQCFYTSDFIQCFGNGALWHGGGGSKYMKGYHFHVKSISMGYLFHVKSISMGYLFHPKSIWMGKIWKIVYEWVLFSLWDIYECVCFLISPSIWMGWGRGLHPQVTATYPPPPLVPYGAGSLGIWKIAQVWHSLGTWEG